MTYRPLTFALFLSLSLPLAAQAQAPGLDSARRALATYDLEGDVTLEVIRQLGSIMAHPPGRRQAREAAFLRDMAAADLLMLEPSDAMRLRVAQALGVDADEVVAWLTADLRRAAVGPYRESAAQGLDALALRGSDSPDYSRAQGPRRDAQLLTAVQLALASARPIESLATLHPDPCADGATCSEALEHFGSSGRRAVSALVEARACVFRLVEASAGGEPFARAAAQALPGIVAAMDAAVLMPAPRLPEDASLPAVAEGEAVAHFDAVLLLRDRELRLGYAAHARVAESGEVTLEPADVPLLPDTRTFRLPGGFRPVVSAIPALTRALPEALEGQEVALGVSPEVPAHVMSRVFLSARDAHIEPRLLLARTTGGGLRAMAFRGVAAGERLPPSEMRVHVRLGGYAVVSAAGTSVSLPRVRGEDGLQFDVAGLSQLVDQRSPGSASLRFMSVVDSGPVLLAAFGMEPTSDALTMVIP